MARALGMYLPAVGQDADDGADKLRPPLTRGDVLEILQEIAGARLIGIEVSVPRRVDPRRAVQRVHHES